MKKCLLIVIMLCSMTFAGQAMAGMVGTPGDLTITFRSTASSLETINVGDTIPFYMVIGGLGGNTSPSLSGFSLDVTYDPTVLALNSVNIGISNFTNGSGPTPVTSKVIVPGTVSLSLDSFLSAAELDALQGSYITMAVFTFTGVGSGSTTFGLENISLYDGSGSLYADPAIVSTTVEVNPVPLPASVFLFGAGLVGLLGFRKKKVS